MASENQAVKHRLAMSGIGMMGPALGLEVLTAISASPPGHLPDNIMAASVDWWKLLSIVPNTMFYSAVRDHVGAFSPPKSVAERDEPATHTLASRHATREKPAHTRAEPPNAAAIVDVIRDIVVGVSGAEVGVADPLLSAGLDSVGAPLLYVERLCSGSGLVCATPEARWGRRHTCRDARAQYFKLLT
jgi:hypothetical protein